MFTLDSAFVEVQEMFSLHGRLTNAMFHQRNTLIKLTHYDETKKRAQKWSLSQDLGPWYVASEL